MLKRVWSVVLVVALVMPLMTASAQDNSALQAVLDEAVAAGTPGIVLWIDTPDGTISAAAGYADADKTIPLTPTDAFRIGSITKTFTAVVILQLMEEGVLSLDDTLAAWVPSMVGVVPNAEVITLRQLLNHTAGVPSYTDNPAFLNALRTEYSSPWEPADLMAYVGDEADFAPGEDWYYSNSGYILLGMVIEAATGRSIVEEYHARILDPLAMQHTYLADSEDPTVELVHGFSHDVPDTDVINVSVAWAAGAMVSTAPDLLTFMRALVAGELFADPATLATMQETVTIAPRAEYGLGLAYYEERWWGHDGQITGFMSQLFYDPALDLVVVMLANNDYRLDVAAEDIFAAAGVE